MKTKQIHQFNYMLMVLKSIAKGYKTPDQLRKDPDAEFHGFEEFISMVYENIQSDAAQAIRGVRKIKIEQTTLTRQQMQEREDQSERRDELDPSGGQ